MRAEKSSEYAERPDSRTVIWSCPLQNEQIHKSQIILLGIFAIENTGSKAAYQSTSVLSTDGVRDAFSSSTWNSKAEESSNGYSVQKNLVLEFKVRNSILS